MIYLLIGDFLFLSLLLAVLLCFFDLIENENEELILSAAVM